MTLSRRRFLQGAAAAGAAASVPFYINRAFAQNQTLRIYAWAGYFSDEMLADFTAKTGIKASIAPGPCRPV